jgi:DNA polymerase-3 subunit gamma/tau
VVGQEHVVQTLRNAVRAGRVAHAYLFAGPRGTGKTTTARLLAKAANCLAESLADRPCNACDNCRAVNEGRFLDLIEIDAASNTSVDDVRELRDRVNFAPSKGRSKVYIIDEVHMLSTAAFNALLKTLEEPPAHVIFVLATTEVHKIPATVLSRCQRHEFRRVPVSTMVEFLRAKCAQETLAAEGSALELIARQATGSLRDAISLLDQLSSTGEEVSLSRAQAVLGTVGAEAVRGIVQALLDQDSRLGLTRINGAVDSGADPRQLARQVVDHLRSLLLIRLAGVNPVDVPQGDREDMAAQAASVEPERLLAAIQAFGRAAQEGRTTWQPSLPLELAFVEAAYSPAEAKPVAAPPSRPPKPAQPAASQRPPAAAPPAGKLPGNPGSTSAPIARPLTFASVMSAWREVMTAAYQRNPQTQALLNSCRPLGLEGGHLVLGFSSDLLREKMEKGHNLTLVRQALEEVFGQPVGIRCVLLKAWTPDAKEEEPPPAMEEGGMVATAVRDLGAQVVDVKPVAPDSGA